MDKFYTHLLPRQEALHCSPVLVTLPHRYILHLVNAFRQKLVILHHHGLLRTWVSPRPQSSHPLETTFPWNRILLRLQILGVPLCEPHLAPWRTLQDRHGQLHLHMGMRHHGTRMNPCVPGASALRLQRRAWMPTMNSPAHTLRSHLQLQRPQPRHRIIQGAM